jgi:hypothetical protein
LPFETEAAHLLFQLVSRRYERGSLLVTSNRAVGEWGSVFGDPVVATAILDRLLHHSHVLTIRGDSYREREERRSGLLQKAGSSGKNQKDGPRRGSVLVSPRGQFRMSLDTMGWGSDPEPTQRRAADDAPGDPGWLTIRRTKDREVKRLPAIEPAWCTCL